MVPDEAGGIWTWEAHGSAAAQNQRLIRFDEETGETLKALDLLEDIILGNDQGRLRFVLPESFRFKENTGEGPDDIFHPNELEPLPVDMPSAFPGFETRDLLISLPNSNMLAVIGREDNSIKWAACGPWWRQHDPYFQPDGTITVFSNFRNASGQRCFD
ncbi:arylsulfotransferase family protein [Ruegeria sp. HKCCD4884]|uniref:arylsulfotransferase family protein n=1 Tax=Ruegeria sp. HKCCD4884 TaxID=2683022 RepID=UPI0035303120